MPESDEPLYAISLWQPWATLMAIGAKRIETRSWPPARERLGQVVAIHAAKRFPLESQQSCMREPMRSILGAAGYASARDLPTGAVVGVGRITDRYRLGQPNPPDWFPLPRQMERKFGDYALGRWLWYFTEMVHLREPVALRGEQMIFPIFGAPRDAILAQLERPRS